MIEVTIWWGSGAGDSYSKYLVRADISDIPKQFRTHTWRRAVDMALSEFEEERPNCIVRKIDLQITGTKVLQL